MCKGIPSLLPAFCRTGPRTSGRRPSRWGALSGCAECIFLCETWKGYCKVLAATWNDLGRTGPQTAWQEPKALVFFHSSPSLWIELSGNPTNVWLSPLCMFFQNCHWIIFIHFWHFHTCILVICLFLDIEGRVSWQNSTARIHSYYLLWQDRHCGPGPLSLTSSFSQVNILNSTKKWEILEIWDIFVVTLSLCTLTL